MKLSSRAVLYGLIVFAVMVNPALACDAADGGLVVLREFLALRHFPSPLGFATTFLVFFVLAEGAFQLLWHRDSDISVTFNGFSRTNMMFSCLILIFFAYSFGTSYLSGEVVSINWSACRGRFNTILELFTLWIVARSAIDVVSISLSYFTRLNARK